MSSGEADVKPILALMERPLGRHLLAAEKALVRLALAGWPDPLSDSCLLEINCGPGQLQPVLEEMGFDARGCDPSPLMRNAFYQLHGTRCEADAAHADFLPYGDDSFDWSLVHLEWGWDEEKLESVLSEARRVSLGGMAVLFWNKWSLAAREKRFPMKPAAAWRLKKALGRLASVKTAQFSALALPWQYWKKGRRGEAGTGLERLAARLCAFLNAPHAWSLGALGLIRIDFPPSCPMTGRPLRVNGFCCEGDKLALGEQVCSCLKKEGSLAEAAQKEQPETVHAGQDLQGRAGTAALDAF